MGKKENTRLSRIHGLVKKNKELKILLNNIWEDGEVLSWNSYEELQEMFNVNWKKKKKIKKVDPHKDCDATESDIY